MQMAMVVLRTRSHLPSVKDLDGHLYNENYVLHLLDFTVTLHQR